ncbi:MAG: cyclic nucleotide-binding domain-containing protein [Myxococcota bacterium]
MDLVTAVIAHAASDDPSERDQVAVSPRLGLLAVADAPSGGPDGRAGARLALDLVRGHLERNADRLDRFRRNPTPELRRQVLESIDESFARAAHDLFAFARRRDGVRVTLDVVLLLDREAFIGHVGDGRVYLVRRGLVHQLTVDHSRGDEAVQFDEPEESAAESTDAAPGQTRALGPSAHVRVETLCMELAIEDRLVLCSAGLHRAIPEARLEGMLVGEHLRDLPDALVRGASRSMLGACAQLGTGDPFTADSAQARLALLAPMPLLAHLTERELRVVAQATTPRQFPGDAVVFEEGDPGNELYLLVAGGVEVCKEGATIAVLTPGSTFGEMAMLDEPQRSASAFTVGETELMVISREGFFAMLRAHPLLAVKVLWNLLLGLSANLRRTNERLADLERELGRRLVS